MDQVLTFVRDIINWLEIPLFSLGKSPITVWTIIALILLIIMLHLVTTRVQRLVTDKLMAKNKYDIGVRVATGSIVRYAVLTIGIIMILQIVGLDLSTLTILLGALGVGIGFGLQSVTNNFVSGLIILFERPVKVGDRVEVINGIAGNVVSISIRATQIITNDNISIIVPNSEFISNTVINWSHSERAVRFNFEIGVAYGEDPEVVREILLEIANANSGVIRERKSDVLLKEFGDSSIVFILRVWTQEYADRPGVLHSQINYEIARRFKEKGIQIPFPQRDVHIIPPPEPEE
ncbi:MAG: mechanosensitive ion channel [Bacteroidetes bacterium]|nr:mechanosensitive ion channel [Bacteroidota bacterium]